MFITKLNAKIVTVNKGELKETVFDPVYLDYGVDNLNKAIRIAINNHGIKNAKGLVVDWNTVYIDNETDLEKLYEEAVDASFIPDEQEELKDADV